MLNSIKWPKEYTPGTTDNYVSNEVIIPNLSAAEVWPFLADATKWPEYYENASDIIFYNIEGPVLNNGARFRFTTFGLLVEAEVVEFEAPTEGKPGRIAWHGWCDGTEEEKLDVHHAWLIENLEGNRVRILTQETQIGKPAQNMAVELPNPMLNAHQAWLDGLVKIAIRNK